MRSCVWSQTFGWKCDILNHRDLDAMQCKGRVSYCEPALIPLKEERGGDFGFGCGVVILIVVFPYVCHARTLPVYYYHNGNNIRNMCKQSYVPRESCSQTIEAVLKQPYIQGNPPIKSPNNGQLCQHSERSRMTFFSLRGFSQKSFLYMIWVTQDR